MRVKATQAGIKLSLAGEGLKVSLKLGITTPASVNGESAGSSRPVELMCAGKR